MAKNISRKHFIKGSSALLSLLSVGIAGTAKAAVDTHQPEFDGFPDRQPVKPPVTRRGSWLQKGAKQPGDISLIGCQIVVDPREHSAVHQAARFLAADLEKITGTAPQITNAPDSTKPNIWLSTLGLNATSDDITHRLEGKREAYYIETKGNNVLLIGSDFRGTAFAAYALAERLGIDPLYHWTGYQAEKHPQLTIRQTSFFQNEPVFKYRGFFHDDEDVLPRPFDKLGYPLRIGDVPLEWYQRFFETSLRLGMNMTAPYVRVHRRYEVQKCASDWGLYFTSHHYDILLSNPFGIERFRLAEKRGVTTDWDWYGNKENMIKYWRGGVQENKDVNAVWPVGLRGTDDHAYEFPKGTSEKEQAGVFRDAIDVQVKTVKQLTGDKDAAFHFTLYTEMLEKFQNHRELFDVPENVTLVWPDDNEGVMRGLPTDKGKWKHGVYYHLAYFGGNVSKQISHVVSPYRVADEFKKIIKAGATEFMLCNVSEMREFVMEARQIAEINRDPSILNEDKPADRYIKWWINEYLNSADQETVFQAYQDYYHLYDTPANTWFANELFQDVLVRLHQKFIKKDGQPLQIEKVKEANAKYNKLMPVITQLALVRKSLNREQAQYFFEHVEFPLYTIYYPLQAAINLLKALDAATAQQAWTHIDAAMVPLERLETAILQAERPPFEKWYRETWIKNSASPLNLHRAYNQLREFMASGGTKSPIQPKLPLGHNIEGAKLWNDYMDQADKIKPSY